MMRKVREERRRKPERLEGERESLWLTVDGELDRGCLQICGATARDFAILAAARAEKQKGRGSGCPGLFIGAGAGKKRQAIMRIEEGE
jgi:hypothetical protein